MVLVKYTVNQIHNVCVFQIGRPAEYEKTS